MFCVKEFVLHTHLFNNTVYNSCLLGVDPQQFQSIRSFPLPAWNLPSGSLCFRICCFLVSLLSCHLLPRTVMTGSMNNFPHWDGNLSTLKFKWTKWLQGSCRFLHLEETAGSPSRKLVSSLFYINPVNSQLTSLVFLSSKYAYVCILKGTEASEDLRES